MKEEKKQIYMGMFRPKWEDTFKTPNAHKGEVMGYVLCSCGQIIQTQEGRREHWQLGHFDTPVYKDIV